MQQDSTASAAAQGEGSALRRGLTRSGAEAAGRQGRRHGRRQGRRQGKRQGKRESRASSAAGSRRRARRGGERGGSRCRGRGRGRLRPQAAPVRAGPGEGEGLPGEGRRRHGGQVKEARRDEAGALPAARRDMLRRPGAARAGPGERSAGRRLDERSGAAPPRAAPRRRPPRASSASSRCGAPRSLRGRGTLGMRGRHFARGARGGSARAARPSPGQPRSTGPLDPARLPRSPRSAATEWLRQPCGGSRGSPRRGGGWGGGSGGGGHCLRRRGRGRRLVPGRGRPARGSTAAEIPRGQRRAARPAALPERPCRLGAVGSVGRRHGLLSEHRGAAHRWVRPAGTPSKSCCAGKDCFWRARLVGLRSKCCVAIVVQQTDRSHQCYFRLWTQ